MTATLHEKCKAGDALMPRSIYARTRDEVAQHTCALRRWVREILPSAEALGLTAGRRVYPEDHETTSVHRVIAHPLVINRHGKIPKAQLITLVMTAALLYRLRPHLGPAKGKGGRPRHEHPELVEAVKTELLAQVARGDKLVKAKAFEAALKPLELDGDEYEARVAWLYKQKWD